MTTDLFQLKDKVALVTGGSSGIGREIAGALAAAGAQVAIINRTPQAGRQAAEEINQAGGKALACPADVSKEDEVEAAVEAVARELGPPDILVNSHGINLRKAALEFDLAEWRQIIDINLTGVFLACRAVGRLMLERRSGSIVNISSVVSLVGRVGLTPYSASKGGVSQLTRNLALEWAPRGVRVNAVGPGFVRTPLTAPLFNSPEFLEEVTRLVPLGRAGEPRDLTGLVLLLSSPAGAYITGQTIYVDGGWSIS